MMNELFELFAGAYNNIIPADYPNHDYFLCVLLIVLSGVICGGCFLAVSACIVGFLKGFYKGGR